MTRERRAGLDGAVEATARTGFDAAAFRRDGWTLLPAAVDADWRRTVEEAARAFGPPLEREADLGYPGGPRAGAAGDDTPRRYLQVYQRDPCFGRLLRATGLATRAAELLGGPATLVLAHHNCLMTKHPRHSSDTPWHRDLRTWHYARGELVTLWIALGPEDPERGGLRLVPGSHRLDLPDAAFDAASALRPEHPGAASLVAAARAVRLEPGDALYFHARLLHAAGRNRTDAVKRSLVFTFRGPGDDPLPGTRSARGGEVPFG